MKKALSLLLVVAMLAMMLASCGGNHEGDPTTGSSSSSESTAGSSGEVDPIPPYAKNLVMHLDFDNWNGTTVTDASGNGHDATAFGGASKTESYNGSSAAHLKANGDYFVVKNADELNFTAKDSYTISLWYCFDENTSFNKWPCILNKGLTSSSKDCYAVMISNSTTGKGINFSVSAQPAKMNVNINASPDMGLNEWHHFVAVQDAAKGTITTYVDGIRGSFVNYPADASTPTDLFIGAMGEKVGQRQFLGKLDDIQIYDCALSEAYIQGFTEDEKAVILDTKAENGETFTVSDAEKDGFFAGEGFTLSVKFKRTDAGKHGDIVKKDAGKGTYGFSIDDQNRLVMHAGESKYYANEPIGNGEYHAVMIQNPDSKTLLFYLNGVLQNSTKPANQAVPSLSRDLIGAGAINVNGAKVQIKECKLYNYALSENVALAGYKTADAMGRDYFVYKDGEIEMHLPYRVYFPSGYDPANAEKYPMLFFLHGHGEAGMDNTQNIRVNGGENKLLNDLIARDNIIIVAPQATCDDGGDREWINSNVHKWAQGSRAALPEKPTLAMSAAMALLDSFVASGKVDTSRVYAGGISMGGYGTWELLARRAEVFAAAIPLCGAGIPSEAAKLKDIAIWAFHGTADTTVPPKGTSDMETAIKAAGGTKIKATYISGVGHSCWDQAYATPGLVDWLLTQSK
jgi:predicted peptidase